MLNVKKISLEKCCFLCVAILLFSLFVGCEKQSDDFEYRLKNDDTYAISRYNGNSKTPVISEQYKGKSVTEIASKAFMNNRTITDITLPASVTEIGNDAFNGCSELAIINLPDTISRICQRAFQDCINLKSIKIPMSVTEIERSTFLRCTSLPNIEFHSEITAIEANAFSGCYRIDAIDLPLGLTHIGHRAFAETNITTVKIPDGVLELGQSFAECSLLNKIEFGSGLKVLSERAFVHCTALESVTLPDGFEVMGPYAFHNCNLKSIYLPKSIRFIGDSFCVTNPLLNAIDYAGTIHEWDAIEKSSKWMENIGYKKIKCFDGIIDINSI